MRATFFGFEIGKRAIFAQRAAMDVTSHNIANANTEGYARQRAVVAASDPWTMPNLYSPVQGQQLGTGVVIEKIESIRNAFLDEKIVHQEQSIEQWSAANDLMKQIESILNEPNDTTIRDQLDKFWAAWENLAENPNREELRSNLVEEADSLVLHLKTVDEQLRRLQGTPDHSYQGSIENQLEDAVKQVNNLGLQLAELNRQIGKSETPFSQANDLRDKRQRLLEELAKLVNVESQFDSRGMLTVRVGRHVLVDTIQNHDLYVVKKTKAEPGTISGCPDYPQYSDTPEVCEGIVTHTGEQRNFTVAVAQTAQADSQYSFLTFHPLTGPLANFGVSSGTFTVNGRTFYLDAEKTTMTDLAAMIDSANLNVHASINESGQLILDSTITGTQNAVKVIDGTSNIATVLNLHVQREARDAVFTIDGKAFTTQENEVRDVMPGITLHIKKQGIANLDMRPIVTSGKIKGILDVRDGQLQTLRDKLDKFVFTLVTEVNAVHRQ
ncbi:MAG TPA: flagellar hook-associated protein FlgK, partial [Candidatus Ozemobacteraceae bacterium]|nr:flagellar hook-associated protein FlgK [Candidatus Ozemobacteraceae bacterium]